VETVEPSPKEKNKPTKSSMQLRTAVPQEEDTAKQVTVYSNSVDNDSQDCTKLLVFNVHGTVFDCSLLSEPNPNPKN
jgi:hypothetical protein